eukprot:CAMPEP_0175655150 /NCGR_PEP_ID=MMETSP0097-20121207/11752_1 /TAXON_ID=311494 /ORGANISM="Alexandrium monilatum, Strain CCMP3105" /LENGTH=1000 /DNA_ID=CAMNT_0016961197 /DNA_START=1 /DNA_END=3002 /DNA_ORIENTATION=-
MEDLASEFREDFLEAVKVLEDFSSSDGALREAMKAVRSRIDAKAYVCAPHFWADLRESLSAVERGRDERSAKSKAQQVLKQVARLEVRFWAKESTGMLRELDPESRLERMRDWVLTFDASESGDQSSGPAVLYQVLNDVSLQKDFEPSQRDSLLAAVRESLHKFPVEMQAVLERVGTLQGGGGASGALGLAAPEPAHLAGAGGARWQHAAHLRARAQGHGAPSAARADAARRSPPRSSGRGGRACRAGRHVSRLEAAVSTLKPPEEEAAEEEEVAPAHEPFDMASVDPAALERARRAVLAVLEANGGECQRHHVRTLLRQAGLEGMPISGLGTSVFFSATEVFCRRPGAPPAAPAAPARSPVPEELRRQMALLVQEAGGRLALSQMMEALQWHPHSIRHSMHGNLRKAVTQVPELFFEPKRVFSAGQARRYITALGDVEEEPPEQPADAATASAVPYIADPFAELLATIQAWLEREEGVLSQDSVLPLVKAMGFKLRSVIAALSRSVFWCHPEAECEILLRTPAGAAQHPRPLPKVYLHEQVHQKLLAHIRSMGSKAKYDKLAGALGWNARSELRKAYGTLRVVLAGLREVFFDPARIYLKRALDGLVEWPVNREGRLGPAQAEEAPPLQHWTPAADDPRAACDPAWLGVRRQVLGALMHRGGACEAEVLRPLLQPLEGVELEALLEPGSSHDLSELLLWPRDIVYCRRPEAVVEAMVDAPVTREARLALADVVRRQGPLRVEELRAALEANGTADAEALLAALPQVPELLFAPGVVLLRRVAEATAILVREDEPPPAGAAEAVPALPASEAAVEAAKTPAEPEAAAPAPASTPQFFSFSEFSPAPQGSPAAEGDGEPTEPAGGVAEQRDVQPPAKRPRLVEAEAQSTSAWTQEVPPWATAGAAVTLREGGQEGVVLRARGSTCTIRLLNGDGAGEERELATPALLPVSPRVGADVRVVAGERCGCQGKLVGLAGADGVVQIAGMSYETLPMGQLAVLAS